MHNKINNKYINIVVVVGTVEMLKTFLNLVSTGIEGQKFSTLVC